MAKNKVIELYEQFDEENRLLRARESKVEFLTTTKFLDKYIKENSDVLEMGCGAGIYGLHYAPNVKSFLGIDISPRNIKIFKDQIKLRGFKNVKAELGDALDLKNVKAESFDVVLLLGPLYHMDKASGLKCIKEAIRVCKKNGIIAMSYKNKFGNFVKLCAQENFVGRYPNQKLYTSMMIDETDDDEVFYFTTPEFIESTVQKLGLVKLHNIGTDGVTMHHHRISDYREEEFKLWLKFHFFSCEEPSLLGMSDNGLLICRKTK